MSNKQIKTIGWKRNVIRMEIPELLTARLTSFIVAGADSIDGRIFDNENK